MWKNKFWSKFLSCTKNSFFFKIFDHDLIIRSWSIQMLQFSNAHFQDHMIFTIIHNALHQIKHQKIKIHETSMSHLCKKNDMIVFRFQAVQYHATCTLFSHMYYIFLFKAKIYAQIMFERQTACSLLRSNKTKAVLLLKVTQYA